MSEPIVYVVDDEDSIRRSLTILFESLELNVADFAGGHDFLAEYDPSRRPACVLLDVRMPGMSGLALQDELCRRKVGIPIIFMTAYADVETCLRAMKNGAREFLEKPFNEQVVLDAVFSALHEDEEQERNLMEQERVRNRFSRLTSRERQVLELVVTGLLNKQIAYELGICESTVKVYRANVMDKMRADSLPSLVRMFTRLEQNPERPHSQEEQVWFGT